MEIFFLLTGLVIGLVLGALVMLLYKRNAVHALQDHITLERQQLSDEKSALRQQLAVAQTQLQSERASAQEKLEAERSAARERLDTANKTAEDKLRAEREHADRIILEQQRQHEAATKAVREEVQNLATQMLADSKQQLSADNKEKLESLLAPLRQQIDSFNKNVTDSTRESSSNKAEIKTAFEDAMRKLHDEQERTVRELREQTDRIGNDAAQLTRALKGDSKMQGDWGEMILEKTLEDCGLEKDRQYFLQQNFKDSDGNNFRPDAIVEFPNRERAVIDSKVSLTAYLEATRTDDADERERLLREHVRSVRKHVDELSAVGYDKIVPGCIGYVLMFIPYESGYAAALKADPTLLQYAYRKHIIMLSPSNLLMALQLTRTMWQNYRVNKNVEEILRQSNDLYDKFCTFADTFLRIGADIDRLRRDYDQSHSQLTEGNGNVIRRLDNLKTLGITPKKQIPDSL